MSTSFTTISAALSCSSFELLDIIAVVMAVKSDHESKGFISITDSSTDGQAGISVHGSKLVELLAALSPGRLILVSGLESNSKRNGITSTTARKGHHFRLSTNGYSTETTAAIQVLNDDDLVNVRYNHHPDASNLVKLSHEIKNKQALNQPTRCRRRRLAEIQFVGQLSTVQIKVVSCEEVSIDSRMSHWQRKRRRDSNKKNAFATLMDGGVRMVLADCRKLAKELKAAQQSGAMIQLAHLMSSESDTGEIVLKPTMQTLILPAVVGTRQSLSPISTQQQSIMNDGIGEDRVVLSHMEAIFVDAVDKLVDPVHDAPSAIVAAIIKTGPIPTYRSAIVTLKGALVVKSNSSVMKTLCGSIAARQVLAHAQTKRLVHQLIVSLLTDQSVQLRWTLTDDNTVRQVEIANL